MMTKGLQKQIEAVMSTSQDLEYGMVRLQKSIGKLQSDFKSLTPAMPDDVDRLNQKIRDERLDANDAQLAVAVIIAVVIGVIGKPH